MTGPPLINLPVVKRRFAHLGFSLVHGFWSLANWNGQNAIRDLLELRWKLWMGARLCVDLSSGGRGGVPERDCCLLEVEGARTQIENRCHQQVSYLLAAFGERSRSFAGFLSGGWLLLHWIVLPFCHSDSRFPLPGPTLSFAPHSSSVFILSPRLVGRLHDVQVGGGWLLRKHQRYGWVACSWCFDDSTSCQQTRRTEHSHKKDPLRWTVSFLGELTCWSLDDAELFQVCSKTCSLRNVKYCCWEWPKQSGALFGWAFWGLCRICCERGLIARMFFLLCWMFVSCF